MNEPVLRREDRNPATIGEQSCLFQNPRTLVGAKATCIIRSSWTAERLRLSRLTAVGFGANFGVQI
jgi:hypothetical protein